MGEITRLESSSLDINNSEQDKHRAAQPQPPSHTGKMDLHWADYARNYLEQSTLFGASILGLTVTFTPPQPPQYHIITPTSPCYKTWPDLKG